MTKVQKRTFSLTSEQAAYIDEKVASGNYVSSSEVIREGLRAMQERDAAVEKWLREEVVPTVRKYESDPEQARPVDEVFNALLAEFEGDVPARGRV